MAIKIFKTPQLVASLSRNRLWGFSLNEPKVYLTFDDGPNQGVTDWVLDYLKNEQILATFFCVGENVLRNPDLIQRIRDEGHAIGGHCMRHENSAKTHWKVYRNSVQECQKILKTRLFRPPYGRLSQWRAFQIAKEFQIVMWSWLSYDFDPKMEVDIIKKSAKKHIRNGSILVLHDNQKMSERIKTILPVVIEICRSKGLEFAIIPEPSKKS